MVAKKALYSQLRSLGLHFRFFGRSEIAELVRIIEPYERVLHGVHGYYHGGSAVLVATSHRLLLVDKRKYMVYLEEHLYDQFLDIDISIRRFQATLLIKAGHKITSFRSIKDADLKALHDIVQNKIGESQLVAQNTTVPHVDTVWHYRKHPAWRPHSPHLIRLRPSKFVDPRSI